MSSPDLNPYSAPTGFETSLSAEQLAATARLRIPSIGILVLAVLTAFAGMIGFVISAVFWIAYIRRYGFPEDFGLPHDSPTIVELVTAPLVVAMNVFHTYAALCMRRGVRYRVAMASAIASCIPFLSPMVYFGIPFGIWALVVLRRKDVRGAFQPNVTT